MHGVNTRTEKQSVSPEAMGPHPQPRLRHALRPVLAFLAVAALTMAAPLTATACGAAKTSAERAAGADHEKPGKDIVTIASSAGSFQTLVTAVKEAGLVDVLQGDGPFTVFAPTDEAFAKIPREKLQKLLADKEALTKVLTYHVVPGRMKAADVASARSLKTVQGQSIAVDTSSGVKVDEANVVKTDIAASNGVIHVIDRVIMPE